MKDVETRVHLAVKKYLERRGFDIVDERPNGLFQFVAYDNEKDQLAFIQVDWTTKLMEDPTAKVPFEAVEREKFEQAAALFLVNQIEYDFVDVTVRYDIVQVRIISDDRAFLAHCVNSNFKEE